MNNRFILVLLLFTVAISSCSKKEKESPPPPVDPTYFMNPMEKEVFSAINGYRKSIGLSELLANEYVTIRCRNHSYDMATAKCAFGHDGFSTRMDSVSTQMTVLSSGENVYWGSYTSTVTTGIGQRSLSAWLNSPPHKANIEGTAWNLTGIGCVQASNYSVYITQIFLKKG